MIYDFGFFIGDTVVVKDSHPFLGTAFNVGEIFMFVGLNAAIVEFHANVPALCYETEEEFDGKYWYIPLIHLERICSGSTEMGLLLENQKLRTLLEAYKSALEDSEDLRQKLSEQIK